MLIYKWLEQHPEVISVSIYLHKGAWFCGFETVMDQDLFKELDQSLYVFSLRHKLIKEFKLNTKTTVYNPTHTNGFMIDPEERPIN